MTRPPRVLRPTSLRRKAASIRAFYRFCYAEELIDADIAALIDLPRQMQRLPDTLDAQEVVELLDASRRRRPRRPARPRPAGAALRGRLARQRGPRARPRGPLHERAASCASSARATRSDWCPVGDMALEAIEAYLAERDRLAEHRGQGARRSMHRAQARAAVPVATGPAPRSHGRLAGDASGRAAGRAVRACHSAHVAA